MTWLSGWWRPSEKGEAMMQWVIVIVNIQNRKKITWRPSSAFIVAAWLNGSVVVVVVATAADTVGISSSRIWPCPSRTTKESVHLFRERLQGFRPYTQLISSIVAQHRALFNNRTLFCLHICNWQLPLQHFICLNFLDTDNWQVNTFSYHCTASLFIRIILCS